MRSFINGYERTVEPIASEAAPQLHSPDALVTDEVGVVIEPMVPTPDVVSASAPTFAPIVNNVEESMSLAFGYAIVRESLDRVTITGKGGESASMDPSAKKRGDTGGMIVLDNGSGSKLYISFALDTRAQPPEPEPEAGVAAASDDGAEEKEDEDDEDA